MKERFQPVEIEIIRFDLEDVIATSGDCENEGDEI